MGFVPKAGDEGMPADMKLLSILPASQLSKHIYKLDVRQPGSMLRGSDGPALSIARLPSLMDSESGMDVDSTSARRLDAPTIRMSSVARSVDYRHRPRSVDSGRTGLTFGAAESAPTFTGIPFLYLFNGHPGASTRSPSGLSSRPDTAMPWRKLPSRCEVKVLSFDCGGYEWALTLTQPLEEGGK